MHTVRWLVVLLGVWGLALSVWAQPKGKGHGHDREESGSVEQKLERAGHEAMDVVADELLGEQTTTPAGMPPGLSKKDKLPPGLEKQDKTPPGWNKGKKEGWDKTAESPKKESPFRRLIRGIFRRSTAPTPDASAQPATP